MSSKYKKYYESHKTELRAKARLRMSRIREERKLESWRAHSQDPDDGLSDTADGIQTHSDADWAVGDDGSSPTCAAHQDFLDMARLVHDWTTHWGGVHGWGLSLDRGYADAKQSGTLNQWVCKVLEHADRGRLLVRMLHQTNTVLPMEMWKIRELWRQYTDLLTLVVKGLTLIEVRVDILNSGQFNLWNGGVP